MAAPLTDAEVAAAAETIGAGASELARKANELRASVWNRKEFTVCSCMYLFEYDVSAKHVPADCSSATHASVILATRDALRVHYSEPPAKAVFVDAYNAIVTSARASGAFE
jgi:hypothetical protein